MNTTHCGKDYWGKRPISGWSISDNNRWKKRYCHSVERMLGKKEIEERLKTE